MNLRRSGKAYIREPGKILTMARDQTFFLLLIVILLAGSTALAGCTTSSPALPPTTVTPPPSPAVTAEPATPVPVPVNTTVPVTVSPIAITTPGLTSDDVTQHFMDIAFGGGNSRLGRLSYNPTEQKPKNSIAFYNGNQADLDLLRQFVADFNDLSSTNQFLTTFKSGTAGDIVIKFISQDGMDAIPRESVEKEYKGGGVSYAKISTDTIYINADLKGDLRSHVLLRSFLYALGFPGETLKFSDSVFYFDTNTNTKLDLADRKAIQIMYSTGLYPGMTVEDVRKVVFVKSS